MTVDPVCGMEVETSKSLWKLEIEGATHHFCGSVCMQTFSKHIRKDRDIDIETRLAAGEDQESYTRKVGGHLLVERSHIAKQRR